MIITRALSTSSELHSPQSPWASRTHGGQGGGQGAAPLPDEAVVSRGGGLPGLSGQSRLLSFWDTPALPSPSAFAPGAGIIRVAQGPSITSRGPTSGLQPASLLCRPSPATLSWTPGSSGPWPRAEAGRQAGSGAAGLDTFCLALFPPGCQGTRGHSPGAHGPLGTAWPAAAQKSPGGQGRHQLTSGAPFSAFQVPAGQGQRLGSSVPAGQKWPGRQRSPKGSPSWKKRGLSRARGPLRGRLSVLPETPREACLAGPCHPCSPATDLHSHRPLGTALGVWPFRNMK